MQPTNGTNDLVNVTDSSGETQAISKADPEIYETILKYIRDGVTWQDLFGFMNGSAGNNTEQMSQTMAAPNTSPNQSDSSENESSLASDDSSSSSNSESSTSSSSPDQHDDIAESSNRSESSRSRENESRRREDRVTPWRGDISNNSSRSSSSDDSDSNDVETETESHSNNRRRRGRRTEPWTGGRNSGSGHDDSDDGVATPVATTSNASAERRDRVSSMRRGIWSGSNQQTAPEDNSARVMGMSSAQQLQHTGASERNSNVLGETNQNDTPQVPVGQSESTSNEHSVGVGAILSNSDVEHNPQNLPGVGRLFNMSDEDVRRVVNEFRQTGVMPVGTPQELADSLTTNPPNLNTPAHPDRNGLGSDLGSFDPNEPRTIGINPPNPNAPAHPDRGGLSSDLGSFDPNDARDISFNPPNPNAPAHPDRNGLGSDLGSFDPNEPRIIQEPRNPGIDSIMPIPSRPGNSDENLLNHIPTIIQEPRSVSPHGSTLSQTTISDEEYIALPPPVDINSKRRDLIAAQVSLSQEAGASAPQLPLTQSPAFGVLNRPASSNASDMAMTQAASTVPTGVEPAVSSRIPSMIPSSSVAPPGIQQ